MNYINSPIVHVREMNNQCLMRHNTLAWLIHAIINDTNRHLSYDNEYRKLITFDWHVTSELHPLSDVYIVFLTRARISQPLRLFHCTHVTHRSFVTRAPSGDDRKTSLTRKNISNLTSRIESKELFVFNGNKRATFNT